MHLVGDLRIPMLGSVSALLPISECESPHTYRTGEESLTVLNTSKPPKRHSPLGDKKIDEGRRLPCVLAPDALMNLRAF